MTLLEEIETIKDLYVFQILNGKLIELFDKQNYSLKKEKDNIQREISKEQDTISNLKKDIENLKEMCFVNPKKNKAIRENNRIAHNKAKKNAIIRGLVIPVSVFIVCFLFGFLVKASGGITSWIVFLSICGAICAGISFFFLRAAFKEMNYSAQSILPEISESGFNVKIAELNKEIEIETKKLNGLIQNAPKKEKELNNQINKISKDIIKQKHDLSTIDKCLQRILSNSSLHRNYRTFICVCQFYQYLDTGRCSELEGPYGCYNLYEQEKTMNIIISELNEINDNLERINDSMSQLVREINIANKLLYDINFNIRQIKSNISESSKNINKKLTSLDMNLRIIKACEGYNASRLPNDVRFKMIKDVFSDIKY